MLEAIREKAQGWIAKLILALIIIPFALWGVDSYFHGSAKEQAVVKVGKDEIGQREFFKALQTVRDAMQSQSQVRVDIENHDFRKQVLDQMIDQRLMADAADANGMKMSAAEAEAIIQAQPVFQDNGAFSKAKFQQWLESRHLAKQELVRDLRLDMLAQQFQAAYGQGAIVTAASARQLDELMTQQREVNELVFKTDAYAKSVSVDDKAIQAYYDAHKPDYAIPEQVRVQYLVLSRADIQAGMKISDEQAQQYYDSHKDRFVEPEQRHASHILIKTDAKMSAAEKTAAKAKADKLYQELVAKPGEFAELAKKESADPGSAAQGGDLGNFTRDAMVKPFADAVFGMKVGELSKPVETEYGYHIIRLDGITPARQIPFAQIKADIAAQLAQDESEHRFAEMAEKFNDTVYEQADSLAPAAKQFNLKVQESGWISRDHAEPAFLGKAKLMDELFAPDSLDKHHNTEAVEVAPNVLVAARVLEHKAAGTRPLSEVADNIRAKLVLEAARAKAIEAGQQALKSAQAGQALSGWSAPMTVSRMQPMQLGPQSLQAIFKADTGKLPALAGTETPDGYALFRITSVTKGTIDAAKEKAIQQQLYGLVARSELQAYLAYLKNKAGVKVNDTVLSQKAN
jgi:peptidyl-prolyl cis-trans isomerase D